MPGCAFSVIDRRAGPEEPPVLSLSGGKKSGSLRWKETLSSQFLEPSMD